MAAATAPPALYLAVMCPGPINPFNQETPHITLVWIGSRTDDELKAMYTDLQALVEAFKRLAAPPVFVMRNLAILGKPADIAAGRGFIVRKCDLYTPALGDGGSAPLAILQLMSFYKKWYKHEDGQGEERLKGPTFHVTIGPVEKPETTEAWLPSAWKLYMYNATMLPAGSLVLKQRGVATPLFAYEFGATTA